MAWGGLALLLALSASAGASQDVDFTILLPDVERVHLLGTFNDWAESDDSLMSNDGGLWTITVPLDEGHHEYFFRTEGGAASGRNTTSDWKSPRLKRGRDGSYYSILRIPEDLDDYRARLRQGTSTPEGIDVPLSYLAFPDEDAAFFPSGYRRLGFMASPPPGEWTLPEFSSKEPLYTVLELGGSRFLVVLDRSPADAPFYNRLHVDRNGNRDLTDEEPLAPSAVRHASESYHSSTFPSVDVLMESNGRLVPYRFAWQLSGSVPQGLADADSRSEAMRLRSVNLFIKPACAYMGEFQLDGKAYRIALGDSGADGSFSEKVSLPRHMHASSGQLYPSGDSFLITSRNYFAGMRGLLLGDFLAVGDRLLHLHLDLPAGSLRLEPREAGRVDLPGPMQSLSMICARGQGFMAVETGRQVPVPPGDWTLLNYSLQKEDDWGDTWLLQCVGSDRTPVLRVSLQDSATLDVGEPLKSQVQLPPHALAQAVQLGSLRMSILLLGKQDEIVTSLQRIAGDRSQHETAARQTNRPKEPTYRIIKPNGEQVASGSFEYG